MFVCLKDNKCMGHFHVRIKDTVWWGGGWGQERHKAGQASLNAELSVRSVRIPGCVHAEVTLDSMPTCALFVCIMSPVESLEKKNILRLYQGNY